MKDQTYRVPMTRPDTAHAMSHCNPSMAARARHRPLMDSENDSIALPERHYFCARRVATTLLSHDEFSATEISAWI